MQKKKVLKHFKLLAFILFFLIFTKFFVLDIKKVKGNSMYPCLKNGQIIILFKSAYGLKLPYKNKYLIRWAEPKVNDMVVYCKGNHLTVKRLAGISLSPIEFSSTLDYNAEQGHKQKSTVYGMKIEGRHLSLNAVQFRNLGGFADKKYHFVPKNTVFALGDNLNESYDSRDYGFVFMDSIYAKVLLWK